jgi:ATP-dependent Lon protease
MTRDTKSNIKMTNKKETKNTKKIDKKKEEIARRRKSNKDSDDDSGDEYSTSTYSDEEEEEEMDIHEYRKFITKMFPSKYMNKKVKAGEKVKKILSEDSESEESEEEPKKTLKKTKNTKSTKRLKKKKEESESESEDDDETLGSEDTEDESEEEDKKKSNSNKFNIIFTIGNQLDEEDDEEYYDEEDSEWEDCDDDDETEDEDEEVSTDESSSEEETEEEEVELPRKSKKSQKKSKKEEETEDEEEEEQKKPSKKSKNNKKDDSKNAAEVKKEESGENFYDDILDKLKHLQDTNKDNKLVKQCVQVYEDGVKESKKKQEKKAKKQKAKNSRIFKRIVRDKNTMNDFTFFEKLEAENQKKIIKEVREINKIVRVEKPYRITLLESNIPAIFKAAAMKKIASLRYMEPGSGEYYKIKNWVDTFMRIPFGKYETLPINIQDGVDACHEFMETAQKTLDTAVYGLNDAKMQIMQMLGQLITNPMAIGTAIAIHGPPGTGKTSLVKEGISKILNRPFAFIALGGATDSSFLEGHSYTYEGSVWGKIVQILVDSKCMNPVIYFDELDKISDTPKGEEIAGILTHLTDTSQNSQFHDKYFAEIDFDLSKCLFIFSYNDESKVNPILKDRMYKIQTKGYEKKQKTVISNQYLLPKIREQVKFAQDDIIIPDDSINYIIENHCFKEDGVRNLKRCLEIIHTKLNLYRLMKPGSNLFEENMSLKVEFPLTITTDIIDKLIKKDKDLMNNALYGLYV